MKNIEELRPCWRRDLPDIAPELALEESTAAFLASFCNSRWQNTRNFGPKLSAYSAPYERPIDFVRHGPYPDHTIRKSAFIRAGKGVGTPPEVDALWLAGSRKHGKAASSAGPDHRLLLG